MGATPWELQPPARGAGTPLWQASDHPVCCAATPP